MNDVITNNSSQLWFRIAKLQPQIRNHVSVHRHEYRGDIWYVYQDHSTNRFHRFDYYTHQFISLMNGKRCVQDIWEILKRKQGKEFATQDEIFYLLGKLHHIDLLQSNSNPDVQELYQRAEQRRKNKWKIFFRNPVAFRISLFDPDNLLTYLLPIVRPIFKKSVIFFWIAILLLASILTISFWPELSSNFTAQALHPKNLFLLVIIYPFIKLLHELGHAFSVKYWGGEVHEIGVIFVLLIPIPYVDASSSSAFPHKHQRIIVSASGIIVELFIACFALFVWLSVEPGVVSTISYNAMLISGISTLFFNGNPLLRYDGYYVLSDFTGIPNLASRSNRYIGYLIQRYLFGIHDLVSPAYDPGERYWFTFYSPSAFVYRIIILSIIIMLVADQSFLAGVLLGVWLIYNQLLKPVIKHIKYILFSPKTNKKRPRAILASGLVTFCFACIVFILPFPLVTIAQGVIWPPDNAKVLAGTNGFVKEIFIHSGKAVEKGEKLLLLEDPLIHAKLRVLNAKLEELQAQYNANWSSSRVQSKIIKEQISSIQAEIKQTNEKTRKLVIRSPVRGKAIIPDFNDVIGQYYKQGDFIAYILPSSNTSARVAIKQEDMGLLSVVNNISIILDGDMSYVIPASINRIIPEATRQLPSPVLGTQGGGNIEVNSSDEKGLTPFDKIQQIEIDIKADNIKYNRNLNYVGKRIFVKFEHGSASLAQQWYKSIQQLLLRRFSV